MMKKTVDKIYYNDLNEGSTAAAAAAVPSAQITKSTTKVLM